MRIAESRLSRIIRSVEGGFRLGGVVSQVFRLIHLKVEE